MKTEDLSLWNWVKFPEGTLARVCNISGDGTVLVSWLDDDYPKTVTVSVEKIEPIVLTEKILKDTGFVLKDGYWELEDETDDPGLILYKISNAFVIPTAGLAIGITYVHELQNVLNLVGYNIDVALYD